jgi:hypothetical protein
MSGLWAIFGLGIPEIIVLVVCGMVPLLAGAVAIAIVLATQRKKDGGEGNE